MQNSIGCRLSDQTNANDTMAHHSQSFTPLRYSKTINCALNCSKLFMHDLTPAPTMYRWRKLYAAAAKSDVKSTDDNGFFRRIAVGYRSLGKCFSIHGLPLVVDVRRSHSVPARSALSVLDDAGSGPAASVPAFPSAVQSRQGGTSVASSTGVYHPSRSALGPDSFWSVKRYG